MWQAIFSIISEIFQPASDVVTKYIEREESRKLAEAELQRAQNEAVLKIVDYIQTVIKSKTELIKAEIQGHFFQRNWRPAFSWTVVLIIANNYLVAPYVNTFFGPDTLPVLMLPDELFTLFTIAFGGYIVGRSGEKILQNGAGKYLPKKVQEMIDTEEEQPVTNPEQKPQTQFKSRARRNR